VHVGATPVDGRLDVRVDGRVTEPSGRGDEPGDGDLGLAVARGFVEAMHGHVVVEASPDGRGGVVLQLPARSS
jgi:signal transduction histidine kinase